MADKEKSKKVEKEIKKVETQKSREKQEEGKTPEKKDGKKPDKEDKKEKKKPLVKKPKKSEAIVNGDNLAISTKQSAAICNFIKGKEIKKAIDDLEAVIILKKPVPMKGEIPHRKGKGMMSGRFPVKASKNFIKLLKTLQGNAIYNSIENPIIVEAYANIGSRPYGRFGRHRKKRTHVKITAKEVNKKQSK